MDTIYRKEFDEWVLRNMKDKKVSRRRTQLLTFMRNLHIQNKSFTLEEKLGPLTLNSLLFRLCLR